MTKLYFISELLYTNILKYVMYLFSAVYKMPKSAHQSAERMLSEFWAKKYNFVQFKYKILLFH